MVREEKSSQIAKFVQNWSIERELWEENPILTNRVSKKETLSGKQVSAKIIQNYHKIGNY